jgi:hypothetical protein
MAPSGVNDTIREVMAASRRQHEEAEWIDRGETPTFATTSSFVLAGDLKSVYHVNRRIRASDGANTFYGRITDTTYSASTRVSVNLDSGELTNSLSAVAVSVLTFDDHALPFGKYGDLSATNTWAGAQAFSGTVDFNDAVSVKAGMTVSDTASLANALRVGGDSNFSGTASFVSKVAFQAGVDISGTATMEAIVNVPVTGSAASPPDANTLVKNNITKAWGVFDGATATPVITNGYNMNTAITDNGSGDYDVTFKTNMANGIYAVVGSSLENRIISFINLTTTGFTVRITNEVGTLINSTARFMVMGDQ